MPTSSPTSHYAADDRPEIERLDAELERLTELLKTDPADAERMAREVERLVELKLHLSTRPAPAGRHRLERIRASASHKAEPGFARTAILASEAGRPPKGRSGKSRARWRADKARDNTIFQFISRLLRSKQPVRITNRASDTVRSAEIELARSRSEERATIPSIGLPHWDHTDARLKMLAWGMASFDMGAVPFTLRLSELVMENAQSDPRGAARHLQDRIGRHLRTRLEQAPAFWFAIETNAWGKPHLHGAIVIPPGKSDEVKAALRTAGGSVARSLTLSVRRDPAAWVSYATKWFYGTKAKVRSETTTAATNLIRVRAREWHERARKSGNVIYPI